MAAALNLRECRLKRSDCERRRFTLRLDALPGGVGEPVAVVGPSGSGKSTLLEILALVRPPDTAEAFALTASEDREAPGAPSVMALWAACDEAALAALRARRLGFAPQRGGYFPALSALDNARLRAEMAGCAPRAVPARIAVLAEALELTPRELATRPTTLSAGQQQRVALMLALVHEPAIILADEPTAALHPALGSAVFALLRAEAARTGAQLVVATHAVELARAHGFTLLEATTEAAGPNLSARFVAE